MSDLERAALEHAFASAMDSLARARMQFRNELKLSLVEATMLRILSSAPLTVGELATTSGIGRSSISMAAKRLVERNMIVRTRSGARHELVIAPNVAEQFDTAYSEPVREVLDAWRIEVGPEHARAVNHLFDMLAARLDDARSSRTQRAAVDLLRDALLRGDHVVSFDLARTLVTSGAPGTAYDALLATLDSIGYHHATGSLSEFDVRAATSVARHTVERLHELTHHTRSSSRTALVGSLAAPVDELRQRMVTCELQRTGWNVVPIPEGFSADDCLRMRTRVDAEAIVFTLHGGVAADDLDALLDPVRSLDPLVVGGPGTVLEAPAAAADIDRIAYSLAEVATLAPPGVRS